MSEIRFTLSFEGATADNNYIEMYDAAQAVAGFQRSLALTTHLILNSEIITQAPSLKNAIIYSPPFEEGSWKTTGVIVFASASLLGTLGSASKDSLIGHLIGSAYAHVTNETLGFPANYESTLQEQIAEYNEHSPKKLDETRLDALAEKCEQSLKDMHRPIVNSETANEAKISTDCILDPLNRYPILTKSTFDYISHTNRSEKPRTLIAKVSSYNINTYKGRAFLPDLGNRTIPFILSDDAKSIGSIFKLTNSLSANAVKNEDEGFVYLTFLANESSTGRIKSLFVLNVLSPSEFERMERQLN